MQIDAESILVVEQRVMKRLRLEMLGHIVTPMTTLYAEMLMKAEVQGAVVEGLIPPDFLLCRAYHSEDVDWPTSLEVRIGQNLAKYPLDAGGFEVMVGRAPVQDDLERVNCACEGSFGHSFCGWCLYHQKPRFECGCLWMKKGAET